MCTLLFDALRDGENPDVRAVFGVYDRYRKHAKKQQKQDFGRSHHGTGTESINKKRTQKRDSQVAPSKNQTSPE